MAVCNIQNSNTDLQAPNAKDSDKMHGSAKTAYIDKLISEYATYRSDYGYSLFVCDLEHIDKRLLLSYVLDINDFEYYTQTSELELEAMREFKDAMQNLINERCVELYHDAMEEAGIVLNQHKDNGEYYFIGRY